MDNIVEKTDCAETEKKKKIKPESVLSHRSETEKVRKNLASRALEYHMFSEDDDEFNAD